MSCRRRNRDRSYYYSLHSCSVEKDLNLKGILDIEPSAKDDKNNETLSEDPEIKRQKKLFYK